MNDDFVIEVSNLVKSFGDQTVLDGINLKVKRGETMVIMGGSGCGKSTLLRLMIGSLWPNEGSVKLFGKELSELDDEGLNEIRKQFGILFQSGALFNSMSVAENVALSMQEHTTLDQNIIDISVKIKLEQVGLREHADKYPAQISGGMKKRAGLARALSLDPKILFYDEPSAGLDPVTSAEIDQLILDLTKKLGVTSVVVTHEMDSAFTIADRMCMLDKGKVLMLDTRQAFGALRDHPTDRIDELDENHQLIRQFLRGDAEGPITKRKEESNYAEDLLGVPTTSFEAGPAIEPTRTVR
ncbi:MAG: ABC transporter ATP-binding protein [Planctomycetes bacterium]|nr:ABC transporter ATP-binding protein [Planctomycetota bacterium]MCH7604147.1 ABC transporter ATP-binding protein [Planctomycetota bacterium]